MECSLDFPRKSHVVASEYKIIEKTDTPLGIDHYTLSHHFVYFGGFVLFVNGELLKILLCL